MNPGSVDEDLKLIQLSTHVGEELVGNLLKSEFRTKGDGLAVGPVLGVFKARTLSIE